MKTDYTDHWPTCRTQLDAGLPAGPIRSPALLRWQHWVLLGLGLGLIIGGIVA